MSAIATKLTSVNQETITVGLGEVFATDNPSVSLACFGLGSCIGLCAYDPVAKVAGMAHIVLPESNHSGQGGTSTKFADVAVPVLLEEMRKLGALKSRVIVKLVGGAQMILSLEFDSSFEMGLRNLKMTKKALTSEGIRPVASDTGGNQGRTVWLYADSGRVMVRTAGQTAKELG